MTRANNELDMIPVRFFSSLATKSEYEQRLEPHMISLESHDEDIMNLNIFGPKWDYQIQIKVSEFTRLMKEEQIVEAEE